MTNLIGLSGYMRAGKDTVGEIIREICKKEYSYPLYDIKKFSYKLKQVAFLLTGILAEKFEEQEFKKTWLGMEWRRTLVDGDGVSGTGPMSVREFLQKLGTESIRGGLHEDAWVNALFADYKSKPCPKIGNKVVIYGSNWWKEDSKEFVEPDTHPELFGEWWPYWIITDVRFPNEAQAIKDRGGVVVRVERKIHIGNIKPFQIAHQSETSLDKWEFDYRIDNGGTKEQLVEKVREMLIHYKIIEYANKENKE